MALLALRLVALPGAVGAELPAVRRVGERAVEDRGELATGADVLDRREHLDPPVEVARHQVGAAEVDGGRVARVEPVDAAVLEEAADDRPHADRLGEPLDAGAQHADRPCLDVDLGPGRRGGVQLLDDRRVDERVELEADPRRLAVGRGGGDLADVLHEPRSHHERRDEQLPEALRAPEPGHVVEEVGDVGRDLLVGREEPEVLVDPGGRGVVVACPDVDVAPEAVGLAPDDERHLRVDLQVGESVHDVHARLLHRARPLDVAPLVEARLQLEEADRLLPVLGGLDQRRDELRLVARPVDGRLDRDHVGIVGRRLRERLEARAERVVRLVDDQVAPAELLEDAARRLGARPAGRHYGRPRGVREIRAVEPDELPQVGLAIPKPLRELPFLVTILTTPFPPRDP